MRSALCVAFCTLAIGILSVPAHAQEDGGMSFSSRGQQVLESIYVPNKVGAPFSLQLSTEWTRPLLTGGTFTVFNTRPIKRDSQGRIYMERWLLEPKGYTGRMHMSYIQIDDPVAGLFYECNARTHTCEVRPFQEEPRPAVTPAQTKSGSVSNGKAYRVHEDIGPTTVAGAPAHSYRDTITVSANTMGNDKEMVFRREMGYSADLGINLSSVVLSPALGEQRFLVTEITTTEPEAKWFRLPEGYRVVERGKAPDAQ